LKQQIKTLHDFDLNNFQENIKSINTEINMHTQLQITMQKSLYDLRLSAKPWYESMASLLRAPDELNVNYSLQLVNNVECPINEQLSILITPDKSNGTNVVDSVINKRSLQLVDINIHTP
jgi:hypothetical protein